VEVKTEGVFAVGKKGYPGYILIVIPKKIEHIELSLFQWGSTFLVFFGHIYSLESFPCCRFYLLLCAIVSSRNSSNLGIVTDGEDWNGLQTDGEDFYSNQPQPSPVETSKIHCGPQNILVGQWQILPLWIWPRVTWTEQINHVSSRPAGWHRADTSGPLHPRL
jgi:hypothetical protein